MPADPNMIWQFDRFALDASRGMLHGPDGSETTLRPKTLALLRHLLENAGRLVEREALLDAVWPNVIVTDDSVTQCVAELRRALGPEGAALLRTLPKRGYLLEATVRREPAPTAAAPVPPAAPAAHAPVLAEAPRRPSRWRVPMLAMLATAAAAAVAVLALLLQPGTPPPPPAAAIVPAPTPATAAPPPVAAANDPGAPHVPSAREQAIELIEAARRRNIAPGDRRANWIAARGLLEQAIALDPNNARAHAEIVFTYTNTVLNGFSLNPAADLRIAERHAEQAIALGPDQPATHAARAAVMRQQRRFEEALVSYLRGVELDPTQHASRANAGLMLLLLGRADEAEAPIRTTLALAPPSHGFRLTWLTYLGLVLGHQGRFAEAAETLRASMDGQAFLSVPVRLALLSAALLLSGEPEAARIAAASAASQNADLGIGWFRTNAMSEDAAYLRRQEVLLAAMREAGLRD